MQAANQWVLRILFALFLLAGTSLILTSAYAAVVGSRLYPTILLCTAVLALFTVVECAKDWSRDGRGPAITFVVMTAVILLPFIYQRVWTLRTAYVLACLFSIMFFALASLRPRAFWYHPSWEDLGRRILGGNIG